MVTIKTQARRGFVGMLLSVLTLLITADVQAAPVVGEVFTVTQPNGASVQVRIWGDEFYQVVESLDGYTLIRDPQTQFICYAELSADGNTLVSTGAIFGQADPTALGLTPHVRISREAELNEIWTARQQFADYEATALAQLDEPEPSPAPPSSGNVQGIVLLVDFADEVGTIAPAEIDNYCNQIGYNGYGNNGSVRDYYTDVSDGNLTYTNYVPVAYYRAAQLKTYYDNPAEAAGPKARELILAALNDMKNDGFDFSPYDSNSDGYIDAINCFYAGTRNGPWAKGLWPHASSVFGFSDDGVASYKYQITDIGATLALRTFCHENGHMLMYWPDLYDYGYESTGVGNYCLMCYGGSNTNPVEPCAYLKDFSGWTSTLLLTTPQTGLTVTAGTNTIYKFEHPSLANEYYMIENRNKTGRDAALPDSGLAIWHVDENGSNDYQQRTASLHYECTLVQADGDWDLENNVNYGDATDLWNSPTSVECSPATSPSTNWWSGSPSGLMIYNISAAGASMTFDYNGIGGTPAEITDPANDGDTLDGGSHTFQWDSGTNVTQYRLWVGTSAGAKDIYNQSTGLTQQATVTNLPTNGSTVYVRLNSYISGVWQYNDYSYTAATVASGAAEMTDPANDGDVLDGASHTFQWDSGTNVTQYRLWVGTSAGAKDIYNQSTGLTQQATVTNLPTNGSTVYVRLNSYINSVWQYNDYSYTAVTLASNKAEITDPANDGDTLDGSSHTFQWDSGTNVAQYRLWVGTSAGAKDIYNQSTGLTQQATVTNLPTNGSTVYVRLNSYINYVWEFNDYSYIAATVASGAAEMTNPANDGDTLDGASHTFQWDSGTNVAQYRLWVGTSAGAKDIYNQSTGLTQQAALTNLPINDSTVYVRLNSYINGVWQYNDYSYTAATIVPAKAAMTDPANDGDTLDGSTHTFQWDSGVLVDQYRLWVGTTAGGKDIYNASAGLTQQATVTGLPTDGSNVYVRLNSYIQGTWYYNSYTYTAFSSASRRLRLVSAVSRKLHGSTGVFDVDVSTPESIEPRKGGPTQLVVTFNVAVQGSAGLDIGDVTISGPAGTNPSVTGVSISGNVLTVQIATQSVVSTLHVGFPGIASVGGSDPVAENLTFYVLSGDSNADGVVNVFDLLWVESNLGRPVDLTNYRADAHADGVIDFLDMVAVRDNMDAVVGDPSPQEHRISHTPAQSLPPS